MTKKQQKFQVRFLDDYSKRALLDSYQRSQKRLLLLDYDGTLVPFSSTPDNAIPGPGLLQLLKCLNIEKNTVCVISGRNSEWLEKWLGACGIILVAEHGARFKYQNQTWSNEIRMEAKWKENVKQIMQNYAHRCADSFIEEKEFSMVWHFRNADLEQSKLRAAEMLNELNHYGDKQNLQVAIGNKIVEVKGYGIDKGTAIGKILDNNDFDFVMAIGDDYTDEDMFKVLIDRKNSYTIKVGNEASYAKFNLFTPQMVISLLETISHIY